MRMFVRSGCLTLTLALMVGCAPSLVGSNVNGSDASKVTAAGAVTGQVLGLDGKPSAGVEVHGYLISNNAAGLVSNNAAGLISNNAASYRIQDGTLEARTDANGRFMLSDPQGAPLNVEAVLSDDVKAIQFNVTGNSTAPTLQLSYTGSITGRVTAPTGSAVTDFLGADVYVPGTSYVAKTDSSGHYTISNMAVGTFDLVGSMSNVGLAALHGVKVAAKTSTQAPDLVLTATTPVITSITPPNGGPGTQVTLKGANFGAAAGKTFQVTFGGALPASPRRVDDQTIVLTVPANAVSGDVGVTVDGVPSSTASFAVISSLTITPTIQYLAPGQVQAYGLRAADNTGATIAQPTTQWSLQGSSITQQAGTVTAASVGDSALVLSSGTLKTTMPIHVTTLPFATTLAGNGTIAYADGTRNQAAFNYPEGLATDAQGNIYLADTGNNRIRKITPQGVVTTFAGASAGGTADGSLSAARFNTPRGLCFDAQGDLYVADFANNRIRKITPDGVVSTVAGSVAGSADGDAAHATFNGPVGIAVDATGSIYVADTNNHRIRVISPAGQVTTLAGSTAGYADGTGTAARFNLPWGVAVDAHGNVVVADSANNRIRRITPQGVVTTLAGSGTYSFADGQGTAAMFRNPVCVCFDAQGTLFVCDADNDRIRRIDAQGNVVTLVGNDGASATIDGIETGASLDSPYGIAVDSQGILYASDSETHYLRRVQNIYATP